MMKLSKNKDKMEIKVVNREELVNIIYKGKSIPCKDYAYDLSVIRFFSYNDLSLSYSSEKYEENLKFTICYDEKHIYGLIKFAWFDLNKHYSIATASINKNYKNKGIMSKMLKCFIAYFAKEYPNKELCVSEYTTSGWKYLRPKLIEYCSNLKVQFKDNIIGYADEMNSPYPEEFYELRALSKQLINKEI